MGVDEKRYPHYGGRKRPAECGTCHRTLLCYQVDSLEGDGEYICPQCIPVAIDVAVASAQTKKIAEAGMWAYMDEACPEREGSHISDGRFNCINCQIRLYQRRLGRGPR